MVYKNGLLLLITTLFISSCAIHKNRLLQSYTEETISISDFIIGTWISEKIVENNYQITYKEEYQVEFLNEDTLRFILSTPDDGFKAEFTYHFIDENTLLVENERAKGGNWEISRVKDNLQICIWSRDNCLTFTKIE